jgi:hypothetical protein
MQLELFKVYTTSQHFFPFLFSPLQSKFQIHLEDKCVTGTVIDATAVYELLASCWYRREKISWYECKKCAQTTKCFLYISKTSTSE